VGGNPASRHRIDDGCCGRCGWAASRRCKQLPSSYQREREISGTLDWRKVAGQAGDWEGVKVEVRCRLALDLFAPAEQTQGPQGGHLELRLLVADDNTQASVSQLRGVRSC
jgi:hypothetical protein